MKLLLSVAVFDFIECSCWREKEREA